MDGKIEQFKVQLDNLAEKSFEKQIFHLKPQVCPMIKSIDIQLFE